MNEREAFNAEDYLFSFKKINEWMIDRLNMSKDKFKTMWELWLEIKNIYTAFYGWFSGDNSLKNINSLYHRISLFKRIIINRQWNYTDRYLTELRLIKSLYSSLVTCTKSERINLLNKEIVKKLLSKEDIQRKEIENFINTIDYSKNDANKIEGILLAFNLNTLESAKAYGRRFPFDIFEKERWHKEHIFATNTELAGEDSGNEKELFEALVSRLELQSFDNYFEYTNRLKPEAYDQIINAIRTFKDKQISDGEEESKDKLMRMY